MVTQEISQGMKTRLFAMRAIQLAIILLAMGFAYSAKSQNQMQGSLYNLNGFSLNTAYAGLNKCTEGFLGHKSQWVGVDGAPQNTYLQAHTGFGKNFGVGANVFRWSNGLLTNYDFSLALAHHLQVSKDLKFSYSVNMGYFRSQFESGDVVAFDPDFHTSQNTISDGGFYADLGLLLTHDKFEFGVALPRLLNSNLEYEGTQKAGSFENKTYLTVHGKYKHELTESIMLVPMVAYRSIPSHNGIVDITVGGVYKEMFGVNLGYRTRNGLLASAHYIHNDKFKIGYAYDAGMSNLNGISGGSHEILLGIKFCKAPKQKPKKETAEPQPTPVKEYFAEGTLSDAKSGEPLANKTVEVKNETTGTTETVTTDENGKFTSKLAPNNDYTVSMKDANFQEAKTQFNSGDLSANKAVDLKPEHKKANFYGVVNEDGTNQPIEGVLVTLTNEKENYSATTDKDGKFSIDLTGKDLESPLNYEVSYSKEGYMKEKSSVANSLKSYEPMDLNEFLEKEIKVKAIAKGVDIAKLIDLKPIYFESGKSEITETAKVELDKVVEVMNNNEDMHILIGAHTDCTGSEKLNESLSLKRAKAAADYIKTKISRPERIEGHGYGESKPVTDCECNNCTDEQHAQNRRTTFEIVESH